MAITTRPGTPGSINRGFASSDPERQARWTVRVSGIPVRAAARRPQGESTAGPAARPSDYEGGSSRGPAPAR